MDTNEWHGLLIGNGVCLKMTIKHVKDTNLANPESVTDCIFGPTSRKVRAGSASDTFLSNSKVM